jgi:hypothetical protein
MDDVNYKGYRIVALTWLTEAGKWKPDIQILNGNGFRIQLPAFGRQYATEKDAEHAGLAFAKKWIDDGKPPIINAADYFEKPPEQEDDQS